MRYIAKLTDTFGGEPNYSWVRSVSFEAPSDIDSTLLMYRACEALDLDRFDWAIAYDGMVLECIPARDDANMIMIVEGFE